MADGNELDDDLDEDSVEFETEEDGVIAFGLPESGFSTEQQKIWAAQVASKVLSLETEARIQATQLANTNLLANETSAVLGDTIYEDSDENIVEVEPLQAPSKPIVTSRMGTLEISWDGNDFEGGPMSPALAGVNVYAVKTSDVPEGADFSLRAPYDDGIVEEDPDAEMPPQGVVETVLFSDDCEVSGNWHDLFENALPVTNSPTAHQGTYSISATNFAYRSVGFTLPGAGENELSFWVYNLDAEDILALQVLLNDTTYNCPTIPAMGGWTEVVIPLAPSAIPIGYISVMQEGFPGGTHMLLDDFKIVNRSEVDPPDPTPATVWPPTSIGTILPSSTGANVIFSDLGYNEEYTVWFMGVDTLGTTSDPSERVTASVQPLVNTDIIGQIIAGANIVDGSITATDKIIANTITGGLIQALAINAGHIQANAITADKIEAGAITAGKIAANAVVAGNIAADAVVAGSIAVGALDGKLITGAMIRTSSSGQRVQLDTVGLRTFNASNAPTASLTAGDGGLALTGNIVSTGGVLGQVDTATLGSGELRFRGVNGGVWWTTALGPAGVFADGNMNTPLNISHDSNTPGSDIILTPANGDIVLSTPKGILRYTGDTNWANVSTASGITGNVQWRRYAHRIHMRFNLTSTTAIASDAVLTPVCTMPTAARADLRSGDIESFAVIWGGSGGGVGLMNASGVISVRNLHTTAQSNFKATASWRPAT